jgi:hypothetical protein
MEPGAEFLAAVRPLLERIGATLIEPTAVTDDDIPLAWRGSIVAGVRLTPDDRLTPDGGPRSAMDDGGLTGILTDVQREFDGPLEELPRPEKQRAVRLLEEAGAFSYRKSVETVAAALGVSRFTVYNYLNRDRD